MINSFIDLGFSTPILKAFEEMGFEAPTEVQSKAIPHILDQRDVIVMSKTGSGKTAVFGASMLQMIDPTAPGPQGLILTPTRELAVQVDNDLKMLSKHIKHETTAVYGQHSMNVEIQALSRGVSIVTGTPGRVYDHIQNGNLSLKNIRFLVLDEADRMLDMGFYDQVMRIIKDTPKGRITLLFSATIPPKIHRICSGYMKHPVTIEIQSETKTVDTIRQVYYRVDRNEKRIQLNRLLLTERPESCIIFCNTRIAVDQVQRFLTQKGYACHALHGDIPQARRLKTIQQFRQGEFHLLVATDVAARGIHIEGLSLVINYDVPADKDNYIHRIGRTGRAGKDGRAISLVTSEDIMTLYEIEEHIGALIEEGELPTEAEYNANRAEAEKWIQANLQKNKPARPASGKSSHSAQRKTSNPKSVPGHSNYREQRSSAATANRPPRKTHSTHPVDRSKSNATSTKPATPRSNGVEKAHTRPAKEVVQSQELKTKKSFLARVIERILGK